MMPIIRMLYDIEELESRAHRLWDDACSNLAYGNLTREMRDGYVQQTYEATRLHAEANRQLREALQLVQATAELEVQQLRDTRN